MPYKHVFARHYPTSSLPSPFAERVSLLPDGRFALQLSDTTDSAEIGLSKPEIVSQPLMIHRHEARATATSDGRYRLELDFFKQSRVTEFWLVHTDAAMGRVKRTKLNTELPGPTDTPRLAVSPGGNYFIVDDSGVVRLYSVAHLAELGTFQVAHAHTNNQLIALTVSLDDRLIAGLSAWKDVVLYDATKRRVAFVRQIRDDLGWYDPEPAAILMIGAAHSLVSIGAAQGSVSVNVFQSVTRG